MKARTIHPIAFILIGLSTVLLALIYMHMLMVDRTETGLLDFLPGTLLITLFLAQPALLLCSLALFIATRKTPSKYDRVSYLLFAANILFLAYILFIYLAG